MCGREALRMPGPNLCNECATSTLAQKCNELGNQKRISHVETSLKKGVSRNRLVWKKSKKKRWVGDYERSWTPSEGEEYWTWEDRSLLRKEPFSMPFHVINKISLRISMGSDSMDWINFICPSRSSFHSSLLCSVPQDVTFLSLYARTSLTQTSTWSQSMG